MEIKPYTNNAKEHPKKQVELIAKSISRFGWQQPIKVGKDNVILAGHGRHQAYTEFKEKYPMKEMWIINEEGKTISGEAETRKLTPKEEIAYRLADNQINALSGNDMKLVVQDLKELDTELIDLTGFDKDLVIEADEKDDEVPEAPAEPKSRLGDLYELGDHRLLCGDSTKIEDVEKLMGGVKADMVFTSPPYNIGKGKMYETYEDNLSSNDYEKFLQDVIGLCNIFTKGIIFWNISYNQNNKKNYLRTLANLVENTGLNFRELITWDKDWAMPISQEDQLTRQTEQILVLENSDMDSEIEYFLVLDNVYKPFLKKTQKKLSNYWKTKSGKRNLENHKACYPVELISKAIIISTLSREVLYEPFCGSGTNIIAAQKTGRICYGMELDPKYVDVIVQRYVDYTGNEQVKLNGEYVEWKKSEKVVNTTK